MPRGSPKLSRWPAGRFRPDAACRDAVTDRNLVTAPAWPAHPEWLAQFLQVLGTRISL